LQETGDLVVFFLVLLALVVWIGYGIKKWLDRPWLTGLPYVRDADPPSDELRELLEMHGYETVCGKIKFPLSFSVDGKKMNSRLFVDGIARDEHGVYAVKLARRRQVVEWTGSGVRDAFLPLFAVAGPIGGILYVDLAEDDVIKITLNREDDE
jgi:hypothetical protein